MSSGPGAKKPRTENHPSRQVSAAAFGVGDTVHVPGHGAFQVDSMGKRYFTGTNASGGRLGQTGIGLAKGEGLAGGRPWRVDRGPEGEEREANQRASWQHARGQA